MAVSKRLRFEVLKRDNHTCRYCGGTTPDVFLTIDHVVPVALGGTDLPENLVAACRDCNAGKSSVPADAPLIADVAADALRWSKAMAIAANGTQVDRGERDRLRQRFRDEWTLATGYGFNLKYEAHLPPDWPDTIDSMLSGGLEIEDIIDAAQIAGRKFGVAEDARFKYFCGVCWKMRSERHEYARAILAVQDAQKPSDDDPWAN